jgi:hypothetical protein
VRKVLAGLGVVLAIQSLFALCLISAIQFLEPRDMPFGVVGSSPVVSEVTARAPESLHLIPYPNQSAAIRAIDQSRLYGAYVTGGPSDTLIVVPAKSFFPRVEFEAVLVGTADTMHRPLTVQTAKPLPPGDPIGAVVGLLLLPVLIGGYLAAVLVYKAAGTPTTARWRAAILIGFAVIGAVLTDLIGGPLLGAYSGSHFWPLLPCLALVTTAVALVAAALQGMVGRLATLLVVISFIIVGGASSGGAGRFMLPVYWRNIGAWLPPQNAVALFRNVLYFGGNNVTTPLIVLALYALAGILALAYLEWIRPARAAATGAARQAEGTTKPATGPAATEPRGNPAGPKPAGTVVGRVAAGRSWWHWRCASSSRASSRSTT